MDLFFLRGSLLEEGDRLGGGVRSLKIDEQLAELGVQLADSAKDSAGSNRPISRFAVDSSGRPKRFKTTS